MSNNSNGKNICTSSGELTTDSYAFIENIEAWQKQRFYAEKDLEKFNYVKQLILESRFLNKLMKLNNGEIPDDLKMQDILYKIFGISYKLTSIILDPKDKYFLKPSDPFSKQSTYIDEKTVDSTPVKDFLKSIDFVREKLLNVARNENKFIIENNNSTSSS